MILRHRVDGPADAPPLVLGPSLGTTADLWRPQMEAFTARYRVVRYDLPGHGATPAATGFTVDDLADAVVALLDGLGVGRAAYAGVSLGGAVGTALALRAPERLTALVLCCTSPRFGDPQGWRDRAALVRREGVGPVADSAPGRWFTPRFTGAGPYAAMLRATDPEGYAACCDALAAFDATARLGEITTPTLVISGAEDLPTPPAGHGRVLAEGVPGAAHTVVEAAGHLANAERPGPVTEAIIKHLEGTRDGR
ncbi:hypothetical protein GCM10009678_15280 [Actinomadura kijaniata]|uniref:3-oxoadipate enol-lactonase n=1 Tax=Actinomadura namibiensis TaxID=182080 RepID=A0A7W3QML5_ACTNM|nr:3-oxoadipate enol-lactonase [Actinomadura namibiensis]MBA8952694.1 3-oxoadipate enol-lactonase [Actinomadura namibiensis]